MARLQTTGVTGSLYTTVNVGIGTTTANASLSFGDTLANNKIYLYDGATATNKYGFGIQASEFRIYVGSAAASTGGITFGTFNGTTFTENVRFQNTGNVGVGTSNPTQKLDVTGSLAWNSTTTFCLSRIGNAVLGRHPSWGDYASFYHAATTNTGGTTTNYCLMHSPTGATYLNASSGQLIYFVNNGGTYTANIGGTGLSVGNGTTAAAYTLDVGGTCTITGNTGIGAAAGSGATDGKLLINAGGTSKPALEFTNCAGNSNASSTTYNVFKGWLAVKIGANVGATAATTGTHYIRLWGS
jgi:hypothetical protein